MKEYAHLMLRGVDIIQHTEPILRPPGMLIRDGKFVSDEETFLDVWGFFVVNEYFRGYMATPTTLEIETRQQTLKDKIFGRVPNPRYRIYTDIPSILEEHQKFYDHKHDIIHKMVCKSCKVHRNFHKKHGLQQMAIRHFIDRLDEGIEIDIGDRRKLPNVDHTKFCLFNIPVERRAAISNPIFLDVSVDYQRLWTALENGPSFSRLREMLEIALEVNTRLLAS